MNTEDLQNSSQMVLYITLENKEEDKKLPLRNFEVYDYYKIKSNYQEHKKEAVKLIFGSLIVLTLFTSFVALLIMSVL